MGKTDPDAVKGNRKRHLNVIYFVDSARTRSFKVPLGRLNVLLFGALALATWSVASVVVIVWLAHGREDLAGRLRQALATIFEYETRDDQVFDIAYPPSGKPGQTRAAEPVASVKAKAQPAAGARAASAAAAAAAEKAGGAHLAARAGAPSQAGITLGTPPTEKVAKAGPDLAGAKPSSNSPGVKPATDMAAAKLAAAAPVGAEPTESGDEVDEPHPAAGKSAAAKPAAAKTAAAAASDEAVVVSNPVLKAGPSALQLHFDLTNKSGSDRAEGFVYAVAEFKTDAGEQLYIGAPGEIKVKANGQPTLPTRADRFGIKRFKQKSFSFPFPKDKSGTFTGVKIGVLDRAGDGTTTYNVPVQIRVAKNDKDASG